MEGTVPAGYKLVQEGKAKILYQIAAGEDKSAPPVFYNPVQEFNRDLSVLVLNTYSKARKAQSPGEKHGLTVLEALAATGLRSIRFIKEVPDITKMIINDFDPSAIETAKQNLKYNDIDLSKTQLETQDANVLMQKLTAEKNYCDVIDLDPYGTAVEFLDAAVRAIKEDGLLSATFTDAAVLCEASQKGVCFARYGSCSPRRHGMREAGIRVLLYCISQIAVRYKMVITPLLCFFSDFYFRVFVKVRHSAKECLGLVNKTSMVASCINCQYYHLQQIQAQVYPAIDKCPICSSALKLLGPIWDGEIHNLDFVNQLIAELPNYDLKTNKKILGMLTAIKEEIESKVPPLGVYMHLMISEIKSNAASLQTIIAGLNSLGYVALQSAMEQKCIKTTAPIAVFYDVLKHIKKNKFKELPYLPETLPPESFRYKILASEIKLPKEPIYIRTTIKQERIPRFFPNPEPNWGPKARAKGKKRTHAEEEQKAAIEEEKELELAEEEQMLQENEAEEAAHPEKKPKPEKLS